MKKIDEETNVINWFTLPVLDTARAKSFYETILDIKMTTRNVEDSEQTFFPSKHGVVQGTSGRVTGALVKDKRHNPSQDGTIVYINASPVIQTVIDKIEPAGGKVIIPKTKNPAGFFSVFIDTEGNKVGIHAEK